MRFKKFQVTSSEFQESGFTFIEMIVSLGLFAFVITMVIGIFANASQTQRKVFELQLVQQEGNYLMETISRELRMAVNINNDQTLNNDSSIEFTNYNSVLAKYCRADDSGNCLANGEYLARNISGNKKVISSSNIIIDSLKFYSNDFNSSEQPIIAVSIKIKPRAASQFNTELSLQNSVTLRIY